MPAKRFMGVDARREHAFRVPRPDLAEALQTPDVCTGCHAERDAAWAARAVAGWHGDARPPARRFPAALASARAVEPDAATRLVALLDDASEPAIARATAARELGGFLDPGTAQALGRALRDPDPLVRMAAAETAAALPPPLRTEWLTALLDDRVRAVRIAAARSLADVPLPSPRDSSRLSRALGEARAAAHRNADRPEAHLELALLATRQADLDTARREAERAWSMDPALVPAAVNLADVLRAAGRGDVAETVLREALEYTPASPELHHALGLLLVRRGQRDAAHEALARAAELAGDGRFAYALGLLLVDEGRPEEGLRVLGDALERRPGDRRLLVALATLHRDRGEREEALAHARRLEEAAPGDPSAAQLLQELER
jgi:tetratricopeptide (TPR) repeat protein